MPDPYRQETAAADELAGIRDRHPLDAEAFRYFRGVVAEVLPGALYDVRGLDLTDENDRADAVLVIQNRVEMALRRTEPWTTTPSPRGGPLTEEALRSAAARTIDPAPPTVKASVHFHAESEGGPR